MHQSLPWSFKKYGSSDLIVDAAGAYVTSFPDGEAIPSREIMNDNLKLIVESMNKSGLDIPFDPLPWALKQLGPMAFYVNATGKSHLKTADEKKILEQHFVNEVNKQEEAK